MKIDKNKISHNALDSQLRITNLNDNIFNGHKYRAPNLKSGVIKEANISYINNNITTNVIIPINKSFNFNSAFTVDIFLDEASIGPLGQGGLFLSVNENKSKLSLTLTDNTILKATLDKCYYINGYYITGGTSRKNYDTITSSDYSTYFTSFYFVIETDGNNDRIIFSDNVYVKGNVIVETLDNANINLKTSNNTEINLGSSNKSNIYIDSLNNSSIIINNQIKKDSNINIKQAFNCANLNKIQGTYSNDYAISFGTKNNPIDKNHLYIIKIVDAAGTFVLGSIFFFDENLSSGIKTANNIYTNSGSNQYIVMVKALANSIPTTDWSNADGLYVYVAYVNHSDMYMDSEHLAVQISNLKLSHEKSCIMQVPMNFNINNYGLE